MKNSLSWSVSKSDVHCPYENLAREEELLNGHFVGDAHLFLYRNRESIVLGRFQVPWREIDFIQLHELECRDPTLKVDIVRRRSGGGTVYHDLGNWNFCLVRRERDLRREENLQIIQQAMKPFGISLGINKRFDLVFNKNKVDFKVSGCAFKQKRETSLHHGTLLVDANLGRLKGVLGHPAHWRVEGKGIRSTPSQVCNLLEHSKGLTFDNFFEQIKELLKAQDTGRLGPKAILEEAESLKSWDWLWGETPEFSVSTSDFYLQAKKGVIHQLNSGAFECSSQVAGLKLKDASSWQELLKLNGLNSEAISPFFR